MCPEDELLSAFVDDEVPSPWKERMELHLTKCPRCAGKVAQMESLRSSLAGLETPDESQALARAKERIAAALDIDAVSKRHASPTPADRVRQLWSRRVTLPVPFLAAGLVALVFFAGIALGVFNPATRDSQTLASTSKVLAAHATTLENLVQYLESQNSSQAVTIKMPSEAVFNQPGNPVLVTTSEPVIQEVTTTSYGGASP